MSAERFMVVAVRQGFREGDGLQFGSAGGITTRDAAENHAAYCEMSAADDPERYGEVHYVVATVTIPDAEPAESASPAQGSTRGDGGCWG